MPPRRVGIVGFGKVGRFLAESVLGDACARGSRAGVRVRPRVALGRAGRGAPGRVQGGHGGRQLQRGGADSSWRLPTACHPGRCAS